MEFTNLLDDKKRLRRRHSIRNDRCLSLKCGITNNSNGSQDELVYNSTEITDELEDSVIENLFESDCESV